MTNTTTLHDRLTAIRVLALQALRVARSTHGLEDERLTDLVDEMDSELQEAVRIINHARRAEEKP
jgi:hypothetical protein